MVMPALTGAVDQLLGEFDPKHEPEEAIKILAFRVVRLTGEKEALEKKLLDETNDRLKVESNLTERIAAMEKSYQRGVGAVIALTAIGGIIGFFLATSKSVMSLITGKP
jgi:hypothetical protein